MVKLQIFLSVSMLALAFLVSAVAGGPTSGARKLRGEKKPSILTDAKLVKIAEKSLNGAMKIPPDIQPLVARNGRVAIVEWPIPQQTDFSQGVICRGSYYAKVYVDLNSRKVVEILVAP